MADLSDTTVNSDIFVDDLKTARTDIKDTKAIWQYLSNKLASNIDEDYTGEILKDIVRKKILVNKSIKSKATYTRSHGQSKRN